MAAFRINEPDVVHEVFDEEIIVVNLDAGTYYSLSGTGRTIWAYLVDGFGTDEIADRIQTRHTGDRSVIAVAVADFANLLVNEGLLIPVEDAVAQRRTISSGPPGDRTPFEPPLIEKYDDMQDLLALDPIHEVDSGGWPLAKKDRG